MSMALVNSAFTKMKFTRHYTRSMSSYLTVQENKTYFSQLTKCDLSCFYMKLMAPGAKEIIPVSKLTVSLQKKSNSYKNTPSLLQLPR